MLGPTLWVFVVGCSGGKAPPLPDVLAPLEGNKAPPPSPVDGDPYPEVISIVSGGSEEGWWAHGDGFVKGSPAEVWEAMRDPEVGVDRREVDEWSVTTTDEGFDASYLVHTTVHDVITVNYDLRWLHELQEGDAEAPERVVIVWEKVEGTGFIDVLEGSAVLRPVGDGISELQIVERFQAALRDDAVLVSFLQDFHASIAARVHGEPLPVW